jgi:CRP/FNR family transcriptional regulator, cyclic AMP receptor protein
MMWMFEWRPIGGVRCKRLSAREAVLEMPIRLRNDDRVSLFKGVEIFAACSKDELRRLSSLTTELIVPAGTVLAKQGDVGREFFIIVEGSAQATRNGRFLTTLAPTDFFGELALLDGKSRTASVVAESEMRLLVLTINEFRTVCKDYPSVAYKVLQGVGARLRNADERLEMKDDQPQYLTL